MEYGIHSTGSAQTLESMMMIRVFEEKSASLRAPTHQVTPRKSGREAATVGVINALKSTDLVLTGHRSAGHLLARGVHPGQVLAGLLGRVRDEAEGADPRTSKKDLGVVLASALVGGELALATGMALSTALQQDAIVACFFSEEAAGSGVFHESLSLAGQWHLPILYVCERDESVMVDGTALVSERAHACGVESCIVDGRDVDAVIEATREAAAYIRRTGKPCLLEIFAPATDSPVESGQVKPIVFGARRETRDPIELLERRLIESGAMTASEIVAIRARAVRTVEEAVAYAA